MMVLDPIRERARELTRQPELIDGFLEESTREVEQVAAQTMDDVYRAVGLR